MLTNTAERTFDTNVHNPIHTSKIEATPSMFKILSDQLYTQKELAILRELVANAWDAHYDAGNTDTPISIHLPTTLEEYFEVKDYGTGLSKDDVIRLYMSYGASNKQHTNDLIGGFGIGSKSPFCYTDQFTVESRFNGTIYQFQAFIQENGSPGCMLLDEYPTDEANGLTIRVNIHGSDSFPRFLDAAKIILPHIPTKPQVNSDAINFESDENPHDIILTPKNIPGVKKIVARTSNHFHHQHTHKFSVVQGLIPYNADDAIRTRKQEILNRNTRLDSDATKLKRVVHSYNVECYMDVGSLEITASREALSLTDKTIEKASDIYETCIKLILKEITKRVNEEDTWYGRVIAAGIVGLDFEVPDDVKHLINDSNSRALTFTTAISERSMQLIRRSNYHRRGYKVSDPVYITANELQNVDTILVAPKPSTPFHPYLEQKHFQTHGHETALKVTGNIEHIRKVFKKLGVNIPVVEIPHMKAARGAAKKFGSTRYRTCIYTKKDSDADAYEAMNHYDTANDIVDRIDRMDEEPTVIIIKDNTSTGYQIDWLVSRKLTTRKTKKTIVLFVNQTHTKVAKWLVEQLNAFDLFNHSDILPILDDKEVSKALALVQIRIDANNDELFNPRFFHEFHDLTPETNYINSNTQKISKKIHDGHFFDNLPSLLNNFHIDTIEADKDILKEYNQLRKNNADSLANLKHRCPPIGNFVDRALEAGNVFVTNNYIKEEFTTLCKYISNSNPS